jgi:Uma2 family endonuclease
MSTAPVLDLLQHFREMEARLEREPEYLRAEIVRGIYLMSPRPRPRHGATQVALSGTLKERFGSFRGANPPEWLFVVEPEIRSERTFSRLSPDVAGWRRSTGGWPDLDATPVSLVPEWVAEVLSPSTAVFDRTEKSAAYGAMGVGWLWLVDPDERTVETFANVRGGMSSMGLFRMGQEITGEPFGSVPVDALFSFGPR